MATVTGITAARMLQIEGESISAARLVGYDLILTTHAGVDINVGDVRGPAGPSVANADDITSGTLADSCLGVGSQAATVASKAPLASPDFTGTPTGITKTHVGLSNVDNTSDANKPVSTLQALLRFGGFYGDGSDGNVTISTSVTLTRNMYYDTLTISSTGILNPGGWRIACRTLLEVQAGGKIVSEGGDAVAGTRGNYGGIQNVLGIGALGAGSAATAIVGPSVTSSYGGAGGNSGSGGNGSAIGGSSTPPATTVGDIHTMPYAALGYLENHLTSTKTIFAGGAGGAGGGGWNTPGSAGGGGGGVILINAKKIINNGAISSKGGTGSNGRGDGTSGGGGGGGGGGVVLVNTSESITGTQPSVLGGAGGAPLGSGGWGSTGGSGSNLIKVW